MPENKKPMKVTFEPGCFDDFEGTQEELDDLVAEIQRMADTGELFENAVPLDDIDLDEMDEEVQAVFEKAIEPANSKKRLQVKHLLSFQIKYLN